MQGEVDDSDGSPEMRQVLLVGGAVGDVLQLVHLLPSDRAELPNR